MNHILKDVSLKIEDGEMLAVMGPSGSGKSTLLYLLGLMDTDYTGEYLLDGEAAKQLDNNRIAEFRNRKIGFVFQDFNLINEMTALENVMMSLTVSNLHLKRGMRLSRKEIRERSEGALDRLGLKCHMDKYPGQLSGGQKQRVAIARAMVKSPSVILADEPTGALDRANGAEIMKCLRELNGGGTTVIVVTHDPDVALSCSRTIRIVDGEIIE